MIMVIKTKLWILAEEVLSILGFSLIAQVLIISSPIWESVSIHVKDNKADSIKVQRDT